MSPKMAKKNKFRIVVMIMALGLTKNKYFAMEKKEQ
jgi:hypothetical protein